MNVYVIRPKYMYLLVTQPQILKTLTNLGMFFLLYKLTCGSKHFSLFDNGVSCKVLQHHFELAVPASDIYVHGAKEQVAAVPIFFSLDQLQETEPILTQAEGKINHCKSIKSITKQFNIKISNKTKTFLKSRVKITPIPTFNCFKKIKYSRTSN